MLDTSVYNLTCDNGHKTVSIVTNPKYEILVELALDAIVDGYYREAVTTFQAALEAW